VCASVCCRDYLPRELDAVTSSGVSPTVSRVMHDSGCDRIRPVAIRSRVRKQSSTACLTGNLRPWIACYSPRLRVYVNPPSFDAGFPSGSLILVVDDLEDVPMTIFNPPRPCDIFRSWMRSPGDSYDFGRTMFSDVDRTSRNCNATRTSEILSQTSVSVFHTSPLIRRASGRARGGTLAGDCRPRGK